MSYQVLARKWRPSTFQEMVGQEHVLKALVNALDSGRLHHAYLFTGTRGVGKTSIARLFAKALNCEQGVSSTPCGECAACRGIAEGRFVDLIEVDAASRTKVEDTRELLENVQYAPTQGRYKVYLIDEVHMLSSHSFNALLKTLEEPPPHIKFLLATTDPQKLPVTILSRCLQFNLKNMSAERIVEHLQKVLNAEQVSFEEPALWLLGRAAQGSMRDAMSLTDQAISFGNGSITEADVRAMLGSVDQQHVLQLLAHLAAGDAEAVLQAVAGLAEYGADFDDVLAELVSQLHRLAIAQMLPQSIDNSLGDRDEILRLAGLLRAEDVQLFYQIALNGRKDLPLVPVPREGLEMTLLRMLAFRPVTPGQWATAAEQPEHSLSASADSVATVQPETTAPMAEQSPVTAYKEPEAKQPVQTQPITQSQPANQAVVAAETMAVPEPVTSQPAVTETIATEPVAPAVPTPAVESAEDDVLLDDAPPWGEPVAGSSPLPSAEPAPPKKPAAPELATAASGEAGPIELPLPEQLSALDKHTWLALIDAIAISGMTYNIASNALVASVQDNRVTFQLPESQLHLANEVHQQRISEALGEYFGEPVNVEFIAGETTGTETPAQYQQRRREERRAEALQAIAGDSNVQAMIEQYGAQIDQQSVKPLDA